MALTVAVTFAAEPAAKASDPWWKHALIYEIYPRSFQDSNGDGIGDLNGITQRLDYLQGLGVDAIWLSPIYPSPQVDFGYDISNYEAIDSQYGTMADFDRLVAEAAGRGIRVLMDIVPNHTSEEHPWFVDARSSRGAAHRDWYVWADGKDDGQPPNNWVSSFGGPGWTLDEATGQYYFHNHLQEQPDLNWWNEDVRATFDGIFRFWSDRGVAGFRIDVCNVIIKDAELRDNPPATEDDDFETQMFGQRSVYNANRPEVHEVIRRWRRQADGYDEPRLLIGETPVPVDKLVEFYGDGTDELGLAFNFNFINAPFRAPEMRAVVKETEDALPAGAWPAWTGSNHDMFRFPTRWAEDDPAKVRLALLMLLSLRGTPVLYQGDEIGMANVTVAPDQLRDPLGVRFHPYYDGRDTGRTPM
ncbi:MAG: alpha-amylase family glycosyl hydrolase, partial [Mycobacterium sp.]